MRVESDGRGSQTTFFLRMNDWLLLIGSQVALAQRMPSPYIWPSADVSASAGHGHPRPRTPKKACLVDIFIVNKLPKTKDEIQRLIHRRATHFC